MTWPNGFRIPWLRSSHRPCDASGLPCWAGLSSSPSLNQLVEGQLIYFNDDAEMVRNLLDQQNIMHLEGWTSRERTVWLKSTDTDGVTLQRMQSTVCLLHKRKRQTPLARSLANPTPFFPKTAFSVRTPAKCPSLLGTYPCTHGRCPR